MIDQINFSFGFAISLFARSVVEAYSLFWCSRTVQRSVEKKKTIEKQQKQRK